MTQDHARLIDLFYPEFVHKVKLLRFEEKGMPDVPDPIGQGRSVYNECKRTIQKPFHPFLK